MNGIPMFIGVNEKFINLASIALVEDTTERDDEPKALITTSTGDEIELTGEDAEILFNRVELFAAASDSILAQMQRAAGIVPPAHMEEVE